MFERAEVRRGGRAVSFALAALAHGLLLLAAVLLVRKQVPAEPPEIIVDVRPLRPTEKPPPGTRDTSSGRETHPPRKRPPPPQPRDLEHLKPPPPQEAEIEPEPEPEPPPEFESRQSRPAEGPVGPAHPGDGPGGGECSGPNCGPTTSGRDPDEIVVVTAGVVPPRALCDPPRPMMPEQARLMGITGAVMMRYVVEPDGSVSRIQLRNSDAPPVLVDAVRRWLSYCRFAPGMARGQVARIQVDQPFVFKLR